MGLINVEVTVNLSKSFPLDPHTFLRDPMIFTECSEGAEVLDNFTYGAASNRLRANEHRTVLHLLDSRSYFISRNLVDPLGRPNII